MVVVGGGLRRPKDFDPPMAMEDGFGEVMAVAGGLEGIQGELDILQLNPLFDQELDQWLFVGELRRSIYISPVGDYDFDGIDTTEFTV